MFDSGSVDAAGHGVIGMAVAGGLLVRREVSQCREAVPLVMFVLGVADDSAGFEQGGQWLRLRHFARSRRLNDSM